MASERQAPRRLEDVKNEPNGLPGGLRLIRSLPRRVPAPVTGIVATLLALVAADALGLRIPGRGYVRSVFADAWVFLFVRITVIFVLIAIAALAAWFALSVYAHIHNRLWVTRPAGFDAGTLHRGASEVDGGYADVMRVLEETKDRNAELMAALERTTRRIAELEAENADLRQVDPGDQLTLGKGG